MDTQLIESCRLRVEDGFLKGAPICFKLDEPLTDDQLQRFIKYKLHRWCKLVGNPLWRGKVCQIYALDLTDISRIDIQIDSKWITVIIPDSTPASSVIRFAENVKKYLAPHFTLYAGDKELMRC